MSTKVTVINYDWEGSNAIRIPRFIKGCEVNCNDSHLPHTLRAMVCQVKGSFLIAHARQNKRWRPGEQSLGVGRFDLGSTNVKRSNLIV